ncbi:MAG: class I SAM-dependent methyltransferase [Polyangiales bacterium]
MYFPPIGVLAAGLVIAATACTRGGTTPSAAPAVVEPITVVPTPALPDEPSVRPRINSPYFRDDALVRYTGILEAESREVVEQQEAIVDQIKLSAGMIVADIGAGTGLFTLPIATRVGSDGKVLAVDIVPAFLARVRERAEEANLQQVIVVEGTEKSTTLPEASVDVAFMCNTYHHIEFPQTYMRSLRDALKPGATLVLIDFERVEGVTRPAVLRHVRANKETVIDEVRQAGFVLDREVDLLEENYYLVFQRP